MGPGPPPPRAIEPGQATATHDESFKSGHSHCDHTSTPTPTKTSIQPKGHVGGLDSESELLPGTKSFLQNRSQVSYLKMTIGLTDFLVVHN